MQRIQKRTSTTFTNLQTLLCWSSSDLTFDRIQGGDALDGRRCDRRSVGHMQLVKFASYVRPTCPLLDLSPIIKMMESRVAIGLQESAEAAQMLSGMLAATIRRVGEPDRRRGAIPRRP